MSSSRDLALSLLAAANNHGDMSIKLSSLKQVKEILLVSDPSLAADLLPYLADLHSSPDALVRNTLIQVMEETGMKAVEHLSILMPAMLNLVKDIDPVVARQSIITGTNLFGYVLEEMALQFHHHGGVEKWLEELWAWMLRFRDAVFVIALEPGLVRIKLLALKFMETCVLLFTSDSNDDKKPVSKVTQRTSRTSNIPKLCDGHPILDPMTLSAEANRIFGILLNFLRPASSLPGPLTIAVVNWTENVTGLIYSTEYISDHLWHCIVSLATIARKRPIYYGTVLTTLQNFDLNSVMTNGAHAASIQYSLRTAFLGFLRSTQPAFLESRDRLIKALRAANAGDAADQVVRQVDKMIKNNERALRESHKADQYSTSLPMSNDVSRKRSLNQEYEDSTNSLESKIGRYAFETQLAPSVQKDNYDQHSVSVNGAPPITPVIHGNLTPVEQMVAMICALLAEGDRGAESLDILISNIHPDLLADIVINNMKHFPKALPDVTRLTKLPVGHQVGSLHNLSQTAPTDSPTYPVPSSEVHVPSSSAVITPPIDLLTPTNAPIEFRRDLRRDLRRMDPRRAADPIKSSISSSKEISVKSESGIYLNSVKDYSALEMKSSDTLSTENPLGSRLDDIENMVATEVENSIPEGITDVVGDMHVDGTSDVDLCQDSELQKAPVRPLYFFLEDEDEDTPNSMDVDQHSAPVCDASVSEKEPRDLPSVPSHVGLTISQQRSLSISAVQRIFDLYKHLREPVFCEIRMSLIARLVAQSDGDSDLLAMLQKHLSSDYQRKKGHDLILNILDHLHTLMTSDVSDCSSSAAVLYEKIFLIMANFLLESLPASDKAFSRLLGEVPSLPDSAMKLLDDLCCSTMMDQGRAVARDGDRVTQGLGVVWSLILGRPQYREACLNIALKCAVHLQDDVRAKAIRLVANKLYPLNYISAKIEEFASNMLVSAVDQHIVDNDISNAEQKIEGEDGSQEASAIDSPIPQSRKSEYDSVTTTQQSAAGASAKSVPGAQHFVSLYFALCTKKPSLSKFIFDTYGRSSKSVKQAINRHIPVLIRSLGSTCSELLHILSDPPQGCENLISIVLQSLTEETAPSPELIATVKLLYETKLKDASILIPVLSSLSKNEVLPIFPRLVNLPLDKFKTALAYILQGSAHTGPALTPAEVLVAIHDIVPEKDSIPLKKITDACSACFEQRIVFTQKVLEKALNQMVDQTPLPLLFMRTVIQAIDAFPSLVDCVMEILSKLVTKQVWRMPKLWFGFLKCISQTQPHSFPVLLQLPSPQLEVALSKYPTLRSLLVNYASQPTVSQSLPRSTLAVLGLVNESQMQHTPSLAPTDTNSSVHGATLT